MKIAFNYDECEKKDISAAISLIEKYVDEGIIYDYTNSRIEKTLSIEIEDDTFEESEQSIVKNIFNKLGNLGLIEDYDFPFEEEEDNIFDNNNDDDDDY